MRKKSRVRHTPGLALAALIGCWLSMFADAWLGPSLAQAQPNARSVTATSNSEERALAGDDAAVPPGTTLAVGEEDPSQPVAGLPEEELPDTDPSALTVFRPDLDPHGIWVDDPRY